MHKRYAFVQPCHRHFEASAEWDPVPFLLAPTLTNSLVLLLNVWTGKRVGLQMNSAILRCTSAWCIRMCETVTVSGGLLAPAIRTPPHRTTTATAAFPVCTQSREHQQPQFAAPHTSTDERTMPRRVSTRHIARSLPASPESEYLFQPRRQSTPKHTAPQFTGLPTYTRDQGPRRLPVQRAVCWE
ncbi:hypothetical protein DFH07DRAFT_238694 [Mycena maculata]|uniref:Uncharacterized protein n=1 Tax=Mycena maculata TaxID=230809 RepID=A0AAD7NQN8_9AGAR|nr:hypothetical protein DFH07DRAFT_238694 [Mycena maculata]